MKTKIFSWRKWSIWILIGLFSILSASQALTEENIWYFPHLKVGQGWTTTLSITNLDDKDVTLKILFYDKDGNLLGESSDIESLKVGETKEINGQTIPHGSKSVRIESNGDIKGICLLETEDGTKSEAIPLIKDGGRKLDFPPLASDRIYYTEELTLTETHPTIFNEDKDVWGWFSGTYILLHWNPYNFSTFRVYRQTNANTQWKPVTREPVEKPEYFDSDLNKFREVSFKVEAVTEEGSILKSYTTLLFELDRKNGGNHE
jgi:hypothetical protein